MERYLIGFVVGICTAASVAFAIDYSDVDWSGAQRDRGFRTAVEDIIEDCTVRIDLSVSVSIDVAGLGLGTIHDRADITC